MLGFSSFASQSGSAIHGWDLKKCHTALRPKRRYVKTSGQEHMTASQSCQGGMPFSSLDRQRLPERCLQDDDAGIDRAIGWMRSLMLDVPDISLLVCDIAVKSMLRKPCSCSSWYR